MHAEVEATIRLLGDFVATVGNVDARPRGRKACAMLAVVAVSAAKCVRREELANLFWGDRGEHQARSSLRQSLGEIRNSALSRHGAVAINRDELALVANRSTTDIDAILDACARGDIDGIGRRLGSIGGMFMAGYDGLAAEFDEWLRVERQRNHRRIVGAVLDQAPAMLSGEGLANAQTIVRALDRLDPFNEVVARLGMQADHAAGDGASLHRRYRTLCEELDREFGATPAAETRALFHRLTSEPALALPASPPRADHGQTRADEGERQPPMVLVSPIVAIDGDAESAAIAEAATDDIRAALARHADLRVISLDILDLERVESVCSTAISAYILSGKLRRNADGIRTNLHLGNIGSSLVVWSEHLRLGQGTLEDAVDRIVLKAVGAVTPAIDRDYALRAREATAGQDDAVALYAKARYQARTVRTLAAVRDGMVLLERVLAIDDRHIGARLLLAQLYNTDLWQQVAGHDVAEYRKRALALIQEAASIDPDNSRIQIKLAWCYLRRGEWSAAERRLRNASDASPYDAEAIDECALGFAQLGEVDLAIEMMQRAFLLNPFPPADYHADYAIMMTLKGDHVASEEHFEASGETRLQYVAARMVNAAALPGGARDADVTRREFLRRFGEAWQRPTAFGEADLLDWLEQTYVFRRPEHRALWRENFSRALA
ncbi:MAG TPA: tetratricopeptide repeat protein [Sphingomonas sp.]|nr:tetratricopeptide repeat protein [Sphingomonas sp.]